MIKAAIGLSMVAFPVLELGSKTEVMQFLHGCLPQPNACIRPRAHYGVTGKGRFRGNDDGISRISPDSRDSFGHVASREIMLFDQKIRSHGEDAHPIQPGNPPLPPTLENQGDRHHRKGCSKIRVDATFPLRKAALE